MCRQQTYLALVPVLGELSNTILSSCLLLVMMTVLDLEIALGAAVRHQG